MPTRTLIKDEASSMKSAGGEDDRERLFTQMMTRPNSDCYRKCYAQLTPFEKKMRKTGKVLEYSMRKAFHKLLDDKGLC